MGNNYDCKGGKGKEGSGCISSSDISDSVECSMGEFLQRFDIKPGDKIPGTPFSVGKKVDLNHYQKKVSLYERMEIDWLE